MINALSKFLTGQFLLLFVSSLVFGATISKVSPKRTIRVDFTSQPFIASTKSSTAHNSTNKYSRPNLEIDLLEDFEVYEMDYNYSEDSDLGKANSRDPSNATIN